MLEHWLKRKHWVELEDLPGFPATLRRYRQEYLQILSGFAPSFFSNFVSRLHWAMQTCAERRIVDLFPGSGGLLATVARLMQTQERYPVEVVSVPQGAIGSKEVPEDQPGFRLLCNRLHHFRPTQAKQIMNDAVKDGQGIAVLEVVSRSFSGLLMVVSAVLLLFIVTPFIRPFEWKRVLLTYVLPFIPLAVLWDGFVSCFRVYSPSEMEELIAQHRNGIYQWEIGFISVKRGPTFRYLIGYPRKNSR